jgi:hypothetical protein
MSLMDYLNSSLGSASTTTPSTLASSAVSQILGTGSSSNSSTDDVLSALANGTSATTASGVTISASAKVTAATKADADTSADDLTTQIRSELDAQYKKTGTKTADLSEMSPRALSTVILNKSGTFSDTEVYAAKQAMKQRDRQAFLQVTSGGFNLSSIQSYIQQMATAKSNMSDEELAVRNAKLI